MSYLRVKRLRNNIFAHKLLDDDINFPLTGKGAINYSQREVVLGQPAASPTECIVALVGRKEQTGCGWWAWPP